MAEGIGRQGGEITREARLPYYSITGSGPGSRLAGQNQAISATATGIAPQTTAGA